MSIKGDTKVDKGNSICSSDATSKAVAVNGSDAEAIFGGHATAINNSVALANVGGGGGRNEPPCTVTAHNGEVAICP